MWIGTYNGINKYDGYSMEYFNFSNEKNSLSSNLIHNLFEDKDGNIWAGTSDAGINRVNPNTGQVAHFFNDEKNAANFNNIPQLFQSESGLLFYNVKKAIKTFKVSEQGEVLVDETLQTIPGVRGAINRVIKAENGRHWMVTSQDKIKLRQISLNDSLGKVTTTVFNSDFEAAFFKNGYIIDLYEYAPNEMYFLSNHLELLHLKLDANLKVIYRKRIDLASQIQNLEQTNFQRLTIQGDQNNRLWIGGEGLLINYDLGSGEIYSFNKNENYQIANKQIQQLFIDSSNILWFGTLNKGLFTIDLDNNTLLNSSEFVKVTEHYYRRFHKFPILAMCEDQDGTIWMGTDGLGGLAQIKESEIQKSISNAATSPWKYNYLGGNKVFKNAAFYDVRKLFRDSKNRIWVGAKSGLSIIKQNKSKKLAYDVKVFDKLKSSKGNTIDASVFAVEEDEKGTIWSGYWNQGLVKLNYNQTTDTFESENFMNDPNDPTSISNNYIRDITLDKNNNLWVGTVVGLNRVIENPDGSIQFKRYLKDINSENSLSNNHVMDVFQSRNGFLYVATFGGGLNQVHVSASTEELTFQNYSVKEGLPSNIVYQIKEDDQGNIWMMHVREISKLNPITGEITYFEKQDGLAVTEFKDNAMLKTSSGIFLCGGVNGFTFFKPSNLSVNTNKAQLAITDFKLFNKTVHPKEEVEGTVILDKNINDTELITLPSYLNSFEFAFSSLHYSNPEKNQYKYILEGFDEGWSSSKGSERRFASYTNISPGTYTFKVTGSNSAGVWMEEPKAIQIVVLQPWYLKSSAILVFLLVLIGVIVVVGRFRVNQLKLKSAFELETALHEKSEEINKMKLQFFTNISHELRTPLTLIIGPLQQIMNGTKDPVYLKKLNAVMYKNSLRLHKLINQLLDFRKAESGSIHLVVQNGDLVSFIAEIYRAFEEIAIEKDIKFVFFSEIQALDAWFDNDKIEKIMYNLLSNAFKFTPRGKSIRMTVAKKEMDGLVQAEIIVEDFGMGIPKEELESIFERFYQAKKEDNSIHIGTGLGLAYTKHLVEIHKGSIEIESVLHEGTKCTVRIPIERSNFDENAILESQPNSYEFKFLKKEIQETKESTVVDRIIGENIEYTEETPTLLVVEDNKELQTYLTDFFSQQYKVIAAKNGKEGLELALENTPDVIISDLMMPVMDGI